MPAGLQRQKTGRAKTRTHVLELEIKMENVTILFTGGGTAGHVTPNIALFPELISHGFKIHYIGSRNGIEIKLIDSNIVTFHSIHSGKLRRYFDFRNFSDLLSIFIGFLESIFVIGKIRPSLLFSKGGFVSCPVVWAAWVMRMPVIIHESDISTGLANTLAIPFASKILYSFQETGNHLPKQKSIYAGLPIRQIFKNGNRLHGLSLCCFNQDLPTILILGGSQGSEIINQTVRESLPILLESFQICHICGKGNISNSTNVKGYFQFEYVNDEIADFFCMSDLIVSRAGATTVFEIIATKKASLLIPLGRNASRGDQIENAKVLKNQGLCNVLYQEDLTIQSFVSDVLETFKNRNEYEKAIEKAHFPDGVNKAMDEILHCLQNS